MVWCLIPLSKTFKLYRGGQFFYWKKPEYPKKTTERFELSTLVVIETDCTGSCKLTAMGPRRPPLQLSDMIQT